MKRKAKGFVTLSMILILSTSCATSTTDILKIRPPKANPLPPEAKCFIPPAYINGRDYVNEDGEPLSGGNLAVYDVEGVICLTQQLSHLEARPGLEQRTLNEFADTAEKQADAREKRGVRKGAENKLSRFHAAMWTVGGLLLGGVIGAVWNETRQ